MKKNKTILSFMVALLAVFNSFAQKPSLLQTSVGNSLAASGAVVGNTFYFPKVGPGTNVMQLWKTDGTIAGTKMVKDSLHLTIVGLVNIKDTLYFAAQSTFGPTAPLALWKSDGTKEGTKIVKVLTGAGIGLFNVIDNIAYFTLGNALWKTDGTSSGTVQVKASFALGSIVYKLGSEIVFFGNPLGSTYRGLWKTDGTTPGTVLVKDSLMKPSSGNILGEYVDVNGTGFFTISQGANQNLWRSNGTKAGTFTVYTGNITNLTALGNTLYFRNFISFKQALWKSDGSAVGTVAVSGIGNIGSGLSVMGTYLFMGGKNDYNFEPYKSDGTSGNTSLLKDINAGTTGSNPLYFTKVGNIMTFVANDGINGNQIWKTDGTPIGTKMAYDVKDTISKNEAPVVRIAFGNYLLFIHGGGTTGDLYSILISSGGGSVPAAPTNLTLTPQKKASSKMKLSWMDNSSDELGFIIERSLNGTSFTAIDTVLANISTFTDTGLNASTKYYYRVAAYNSSGNSAYSNVMDATTLPAKMETIRVEYVKVYPNPTAGGLEISIGQSITEPVNLRITDMVGREVYSEMIVKGTKTHHLDLSQLPEGIYLVYGNNVFAHRIIIQK